MAVGRLRGGGRCPSAAARRLAERNRLTGLEAQLDGLIGLADRAEAERQAAQTTATEALAAEKRMRDAARAAQASLAQKRSSFSQAERAALEQANKLQSLDEARERAAYGREEAEAARAKRPRMRLPRRAPLIRLRPNSPSSRTRRTPSGIFYTEAKAALTASTATFGGPVPAEVYRRGAPALAPAHQKRERSDGEPGRTALRHQGRAGVA